MGEMGEAGNLSIPQSSFIKKRYNFHASHNKDILYLYGQTSLVYWPGRKYINFAISVRMLHSS